MAGPAGDPDRVERYKQYELVWSGSSTYLAGMRGGRYYFYSYEEVCRALALGQVCWGVVFE